MRRLRLHGRPLTARDRAGWLHDAARTILRRVGTEVIAEGEPPSHGLIVSNHLSYMDVLVYASLFPCLFLSKREVQDWPVMGRLASMAGTIYVERERSADHGSTAGLMEQALASQVPVVLSFPRARPRTAAPFFPFAPRSSSRRSVHMPRAPQRRSVTRAPPRQRASWPTTVTTPSARTCCTPSARWGCAHVAFSSAGRCRVDRKEAARMTHAEVERLGASVAARFEAPEGFGSYGMMRAG
jgi:hypothetical protein